jgi:hypothetical protein
VITLNSDNSEGINLDDINSDIKIDTPIIVN